MVTIIGVFLRSAIGKIALLVASILLAFSAAAQRPSIEDLQAQIASLGGPVDPVAAQVRTTLDLLPTFQYAVVNYFRVHGSVPADRAEAGLSEAATDTQTNYISSVDVYGGNIIFTFGNDVDPTIWGDTLVFTAYETPDLTVVWQCGDDSMPPGLEFLGYAFGDHGPGPEYSTLAANLQPSPCILASQSASADDLIRAQVLEPFKVLETIKAAVETAGVALGTPTEPHPPEDRAEAGLSLSEYDTIGRYFEKVEIDHGTIIVTYGNESHAVIDGETLTLTPYESPDGTIVWRCGYAEVITGTQLMGMNYGIDPATYTMPTLESVYLPYECRW